MNSYPAWVSEGSARKYLRAVKVCKDTGVPATEETVRALYVKYGGLVLETSEATEDEVEQTQEVRTPRRAKTSRE